MKKILTIFFLISLVFLLGYFLIGNKSFQNSMIERIFETRLERIDDFEKNADDNKLDIFFCGSGSPLSLAPEGAQCIAFIIGTDVYIIDSGQNSSVKLNRAFPPQHIKAVFLSHAHSDHMADLDELNFMRWVTGDTDPLNVYGSSEILNVVNGLNLAYQNDENYRVDHHGEDFISRKNRFMIPNVHQPTNGPQIIFVDENIMVESFLVDHFPVKEAIGFRITFGDKIIIVSGDTEITDNVFSLVDGADILIHDGMIKDHVVLLEKVALEANNRVSTIFHDILDYHADVKEIKEGLVEKNLGLLIINHLVPARNPFGNRYINDLFSDVPYKFLLAHDEDTISITKDSDEIIVK